MGYFLKKTDSSGTPYLRGFVCAFHSAALGSNPKHAIYDVFHNLMDTVVCFYFEKITIIKIKNKEAGDVVVAHLVELSLSIQRSMVRFQSSTKFKLNICLMSTVFE